MPPSLRKSVLGAAATLTAAKLVLITANDEWPEVQYWIKSVFGHTPNPSVKKKIVILGTGWGALAAIQTLDPAQCSLTVVSPRPFFYYTPLLAGMSAGNVSYSSILGRGLSHSW
mmetsp:Transcript_183/g.356  ORF Transcript_183/g.356 Transcript_183/m.356 type:complete len:114 (+) Transcript_183:89-430(+)